MEAEELQLLISNPKILVETSDPSLFFFMFCTFFHDVKKKEKKEGKGKGTEEKRPFSFEYYYLQKGKGRERLTFNRL